MSQSAPPPTEPVDIRPTYDVVVAGARVAGAATALLLARAGLSVLMVDPRPPERDTLSTHALMRGGVLQLHRWGLLDDLRGRGTPPVRSTAFDYGPTRIDVAIKPRDGVDALYAPRRTTLDPLLANAAASAGATVVYGASLVGLERDAQGRVRGALIRRGTLGAPLRVGAEWVVGADGMHSKTARLVDAPVIHESRYATASLYAYWPGVPNRGYEWFFRRGSAMGVIPTNGGASCVFVSLPPARFMALDRRGREGAYRAVVRETDPDLGAALDRSGSVPGLRGFAGVPGFLRRARGPGWALVGDAGYFKDPLTAHGITDALRDAELLARDLLSGSDRRPSTYEEVRNGLARGMMAVTDRIASLEPEPEELQELHVTLAKEMKAGVRVVESLMTPEDRVRPTSPAAAAVA